MEKLIYLLGSEADTDELRDSLLGATSDRILEDANVHELEVYVSDQEVTIPNPDAYSIDYPVGPQDYMQACVSVWVDSLDDRSSIEEALASAVTNIAGYSVTESMPREMRDRNWPDKQTSPGVSILTAFCEIPGQTDESFYAQWHGSHTPLTLRMHPITRYSRNVVVRPVTEGAPECRGIVIENLASIDILSNLTEFWGGSEEAAQEVMEDMLKFIDPMRLSASLMSETIVKSAPWRQPKLA